MHSTADIDRCNQRDSPLKAKIKKAMAPPSTSTRTSTSVVNEDGAPDVAGGEASVLSCTGCAVLLSTCTGTGFAPNSA